MCRRNILTIVAVAILALTIGQVQAVTVTVPNSDFGLIYKPGTGIPGAISAGGWSMGVGPDCPIDTGAYEFADMTTGDTADIPGWLGYDRDGWIALGGTYGRDQTTGNLQGSVSNVSNHTPGGSNCYLANGGGWGNPAGGLITSDASLGNILNSSTYTLSMYAKGGAAPLVLDLLAGGVVVTPTSSVSPTLTGTYQEFSRTYDVASLTSYVGQAMTIVLGVGRNASGTQSQFDDVSLSYELVTQATNPIPENKSEHITLDQTLSWMGPSESDPTYDLYFSSTDPDLGPATQELFGSSSIGYDPDLDYATVYYWRVDVNIGGDVYTGNPWTFTTGGKATDPTPENGQENVPGSTTDLSWTGDAFADSYKVYAGTEFPLSYIDEVNDCQYAGLPTPEQLTTYHWQVDEYIGTQLIVPGDPWHFTTSQAALEAPPGDLNGDWAVGLPDLEIFVGQWLDGPGCVGHPTDCADLVGNNGVDMADFALLAENWQKKGNPLVINEFLASNSSCNPDPQGQYDDWIEIYNNSSVTIDIGGMYLTDDLSRPTRWPIPDNDPCATTISPRGYLLIWADGDTDQGTLHASFAIKNGEVIGLYDTDENLIDSISINDQVTDISYGRYPDAGDTWRFMGFPTPGAQNNAGYLGQVADTEFSHNRGFYDEDEGFNVTITCDTPGAAIRYTTDSSAPTETHGDPYVAAIPIDGTTCLRAAAFKVGYLSSNVDTHTYIFIDGVIEQADMSTTITQDPVWGPQMHDALLEIPTISLVLPHAIPVDAQQTEVETSIEMIFPDGRDGFQANAGVEHFGAHAYEHYPKRSMRISFKSIYGPSELEFDLFGDCPYGGSDATDEFDQFLLRAGSHDTLFWTNPYTGSGGIYVRNRWIYDRQLEMGHPTPRGRFVHVYINGVYWGQYHLMERPNAPFMASYFGGDKEDYDILKSGAILDGNIDAWNAMTASTGNYQNLQQYMDVVNYIDYMLLNFYGGNNWDLSPSYNWMAGRKRETGHTFKFFCWDNDMILRTGLNTNIVGWGGPGNMWNSIVQHDEFKLLLIERIQKLYFNDGILTRDRIQGDFTELGYSIERTIIPECARWNEWDGSGSYTPDTFQQHLDWVKYNIGDERTNVVIGQMRSAGMFPSIDAPTFSQHGGEIAPTEPLSMTAPAGVIWYTIDGADPLVINGGGGSSTTMMLVDEEKAKTVLIPTETDPGDNTWRSDYGFGDGAWISGSGGVGYDRGSGYNNYIDIDVKTPMDEVNTSCYIRIPFTFAGDPYDFNYMVLKMRYDDGFITYLNGTKVEEINFSGEPEWNSEAITYREATAEFDNFDISTHLGELQMGNNLLAIHGLNDALTSSDFLMCIELEAGENIPDDVSDSAIEYTGPINLTESTCLKARALSGSTWSALNEATFAVGPVADNLRITEMMYHPQDTNNPDDPNAEFIELKNIGLETTINLSLVRFTEGIHFTFPSLELEPNEYVLVVKDQALFDLRYPSVPLPPERILGPYEGRLANGGERIRLEDAIGRTILDFEYSDGWRPITDGDGFSLTIIDPTNSDPNSWGEKDSWRASDYIGGSPGDDDPGVLPNPGAVVINEVMAHSHLAPDWIELYNTTGASINISGWFLSDNDANLMKYRIEDGMTIAPNSYLVFYEDVHFGNGSNPDIPFAFSENGEEVCLSSAEGDVLTGYREVEDFGASETNISFGRYFKSSTGNFNFVAMDSNTPGESNADPKVGPIVISEIMYHPDWPEGGEYNNDDYEYIELHNITGSPVTLYRDAKGEPWKFTDGIDFTFPAGPNEVTIPANGYLLVVKDPTAFMWRVQAESYPSVPLPPERILGPYDGRLNNAGERVEISMPGDVDAQGVRQYIRIDRVNYSDGSHPEDCPGGVDHWPRETDGGGESLTRKVPADYGNDPDNWQAASPTPGSSSNP